MMEMLFAVCFANEHESVNKRYMDVVGLSKELIRYDTRIPCGNEEGAARFLGRMLEAEGFAVDYPAFSKGRLNLIASKGLKSTVAPIVFTGHLDVVPLGDAEWSVDPFEGVIKSGKLYGRGATDMKSAVAAMTLAAIDSFKDIVPKGGVKLIITANEEPGCLGAKKLKNSDYPIGSASALIVGEPTSNQPLLGHKGALYLQARSFGKTAHSSAPHLGDNAIYKAARAIVEIANLDFGARPHELLGLPTINVGKFSGGQNLNSVPDYAEFTIDVRTTPELENDIIYDRLTSILGEEIVLEKLVDLKPVESDPKNPFVQMVLSLCNSHSCDKKSAAYLTDASVLTPWLGGVPTIILGPGEAEMAHQVDEFCYIDSIRNAYQLYMDIIKENN